MSKSQEFGKRRDEVRLKCEAMFANGVRYVVLLDPYTRTQTERVAT